MAYLKGPRTADGYVNVDQAVRFQKGVLYSSVISSENPIGDTYYVRNTGNDGNNGLSVDACFLTLSRAVAVAGDWDNIIVLQPTDGANYLVEAVSAVDDANIPINVTQRGLKILGGMTSPHTLGGPTIHTHVAAADILTINAHNVEIAGINWQNQAAGGGRRIAVGTTASSSGWTKTHIHDCSIYGVGTAYAIVGIDVGAIGHGSIDAPNTVIERCYFLYCGGSSIEWSAGYGSMIKDCVFQVADGSNGIFYYTNTLDRPFAFILNNKFVTNSTSAVGINVYQTPTAGDLMIDGNVFVNFADDAHCISKLLDHYCGLNYNGEHVMALTS